VLRLYSQYTGVIAANEAANEGPREPIYHSTQVKARKTFSTRRYRVSSWGVHGILSIFK